MGEPLNEADKDGQTAHSYLDGVHEECVITRLSTVSSREAASRRRAATYRPVHDHPSPRREVGIDEVAREKVTEVDANASGLIFISHRLDGRRLRGTRTKVLLRTRLGIMGYAAKKKSQTAQAMNSTPPTTSMAMRDAADDQTFIRAMKPLCSRFLYPPTAVVLSVMGASRQTKANPIRRKPSTFNREE